MRTRLLVGFWFGVLVLAVNGLDAREYIADEKAAHRYFSRADRRKIIDAGVARASLYWKHAKPFAKKYGVPEDIFFGLALGESAFNPFARSKAGAEGMFQFMPATGRLYGLRNRHDRCSVTLSADASARHLRDLYREFKSWDLALAAYNAGAGRVNQAIRRAGSREWQKVRVYLPRETYSYVPKVRYLAAREYRGFVEDADTLSRMRLAAVQAGDSFWSLAKEYGVTVESLRELNGSRLLAGTSIVVPSQ